MSLTPAFLDELRARTTLSALIGKSLKLTKAGREFKGCCPFHNEKTPSFYVNDDKGFYHCFGCSAHGDAIRWLTDSQGLPFMDAVKELASVAGLDLPAPDPRAGEKAVRDNTLYEVMTEAADWFTDQLHGEAGASAREYLRKRGITPPIAKAFGLGLAPDNRGALKEALARFGEGKLIEAGLLILVENKESYDRFRGRLMIPIKDARGRVIAFGGRILGTGEPKYLNSPDTPLFDKGRTLYNLDRAAPASRKSVGAGNPANRAPGRVIVVEGYMDVIALAQAGIDEVVAPLGTALTEHQLERLWRLSDEPILCFDGDSAGQKAAIRAAHRALPMVAPNRTLQFVTLPTGQDPDDLVKAGGRTAMENLLTTPQPLVDRLWQTESTALPLTTPESRAGLKQRLAEHAQVITDPNTRAQYSQEFRTRFDASFTPQRTPWQPRIHAGNGYGRVRNERFRLPQLPPSGKARTIGEDGITATLARAILAGLMRHPSVILACAEAVGMLKFSDEALDRLRSTLLDAAYDHPTLDSHALIAICDSDGLAHIRSTLTNANRLGFSFTRDDAEPEVARRDLALAIEALAARPELNAALEAATQRLKDQGDDEAFIEQQRLSAALRQADSKLAALAQGEAEENE
jgi:DNA primase